jgi:hypothetical protein
VISLFARASRGKEKPRITRGPAGSRWRRHQAMMLIRVPCPGGSGAGAGGASVLESVPPSSWGVASGGLVWTGCGGANGGGGDGAVTLEILIGTILFWI